MMNTWDCLLKVLVTGDSGVGKSSLLQRFAESSSRKKNSGICIEFKTRTMNQDGKTVKFQIWTGEVSRSYYQNFMVVYDVTNKTSFDNVKQRLRQIKRCTNENLITILVGNKCDLESQRVVDTASAQAFAEQNRILFMETSDKDITSVEEAFMAIAACRMASQPRLNDSRLALVQSKRNWAEQDRCSNEENDISWEPQTPNKAEKKRKTESGERSAKPKKRKVIRAKVAVDIFAAKKVGKRSPTAKPKSKMTRKPFMATPKPATPENKSSKRRNYKTRTTKRKLDLSVDAGKKRKREPVSDKKQNGHEIVPFENKNQSLIKAPKTKAKSKPEQIKANVEVDPQADRIWTLWLNNEPQEEEKDAEKAKAWEEEKSKLATSFNHFLTTMHGVFGNMQFSRWKGSVTDSLIGVFLTRNVADVSSSNTYMKMVAKFSCSLTKVRKKSVIKRTRLQVKNMQIKMKEKRELEKKRNNNNNNNKRGQSKKEPITDWDKTKNRYWKGQIAADSPDTKDIIDWDFVRETNPEIVIEVLKDRGMSSMIGMIIQDFLNRIYWDHGSTDLEWLRDLPSSLAKEYLMSIYGLGLKSTECVRLLTLWQKAFPVDTNISRILVRLGWVPISLPDGVKFHHVNNYRDFDGAQRYIWPRLMEESFETLYKLHYNLITFGKTFCTKRKPNCIACPMKNNCKYYESIKESDPVLLRDIEDAYLDVGQCLLSSAPSVHTSTSQSDQTVEEEIFHPEPLNIIREGHDDYCSHDESSDEQFTPDHGKNQVVNFVEEYVFDPQMTLKNHTMHPVYVIPDDVISTLNLKTKLKPRVNGDKPYLFLVWRKEKTRVGVKNYETLQGSGSSRDKSIVPVPSTPSPSPEVWFGTIIIPCRTANCGYFPLNGTYFQINEVFADFETSVNPIGIPSTSVTEAYSMFCGTATSSVVRGQTLQLIKDVYKGFICVREFDRKTLSPMRLSEKFHRRNDSKKKD